MHASSPRSAEDFYSAWPHVFIARQVSVIIKGLSCVVLSGYLQSGVSKQRARAKLSKQRVLARVLKEAHVLNRPRLTAFQGFKREAMSVRMKADEAAFPMGNKQRWRADLQARQEKLDTIIRAAEEAREKARQATLQQTPSAPFPLVHPKKQAPKEPRAERECIEILSD